MKPEIIRPSRRRFLINVATSAGLFPFAQSKFYAFSPDPSPLKVSIFSKHLQFLNYGDMAEVAAQLGFDGIDLTVRPEGHVIPERVETDLPKAIEAMRKVGLTALLMTTAIEDARNPV